MKNKVLKIMILTILVGLMFANFNNAQADTEKDDSKGNTISTQAQTEKKTATIEEEEKEKSKEIATISETTDGDETTEESKDNTEWTDFSKAKFTLKKNNGTTATIEISGITPKEDSVYDLYITSNGNKPDTKEPGFGLDYDKNTNTLKTFSGYQIAEIVEKNQDLYVSVLELTTKGSDIVVYGKKLDRYAEPKYNDAFFATFMTEDANQIVMNFTHSDKNDRKMQIKIGKITDTSILQKIKNNDALMSYAKSNNGIYNQTVDSDKKSSSIQFCAGSYYDRKESINLKGLENKAYYYLYVKTDDENGKFVSNEAVTLAISSINSEGYGLFFYGNERFAWEGIGEVANTGNNDGDNNGDQTVAPSKLPQTGVGYFVATVIGLVALVGIVSYKQYRKYNF